MMNTPEVIVIELDRSGGFEGNDAKAVGMHRVTVPPWPRIRKAGLVGSHAV